MSGPEMAPGSEQLPGQALGWRPVPHPGRPTLRGEHVLLRPVNAETDAEPLYAVSHPPVGESSTWRYLPYGPFPSVQAFRERLNEIEALEDPIFFTLCRLPGEEPEGQASYLRIEPQHGVIEIGHIWFGAPLQRTTAASEAIFLLARHVFDELGYRRLEWKCNALNGASRRAAERFGFTFEGVFRKHMVVKDRNRDSAWYAITDEEWPAVRGGFERWLAAENFGPDGRQRQSLGALIAAGHG